MKLTKLYLALVSMTAMSIGANSAMADTQTPNLSVTATIAKACVITTTAVAFGTYDFTSTTPKDANGAVIFNCTKGTTPTIQLSLGGNASGSQRRMTAGGNYLNYTLYTDIAGGTEWTSTATVSGIDVGSIPVYGRMPINQNQPVGSYADTVVATVDF
jgi:spore coat protein U-like protein